MYQPVDAGTPNDEEEEVPDAIQVGVLVVRSLADDIVAEADRGEGHETEVDALEVRPVFHRLIHGRGTTRDDDGAEEEDQHHPVHGRLPRVEVVVVRPLKEHGQI